MMRARSWSTSTTRPVCAASTPPAAWCAGAGKADFRAVKRACAMASAVGGICAQGQGPLKLLAADRKEYLERFNRLRRAEKY